MKSTKKLSKFWGFVTKSLLYIIDSLWRAAVKEFKTVYKNVQTEIIEKKSKFFANVKPVSTEEEAVDFINSIKSKYWDATHNVYAYVLEGNNIQRYNDDGEPQGTAGVPTLQAIKNLDLYNVVVVITRYFGGTLLGASGLIRAYGKCAKEGLQEATIITKRVCAELEFTIDYSYIGKVQSEILRLGHIIENIIYEENVKIHVLLPLEMVEQFKPSIEDIINEKINLKILGERIVSINSENKLLDISN